MRKFFKIFLIILSAIVGASLVISIISVYISPETFLYPAYFGLAFPIIFLANFIMLILWIVRKKIALIVFCSLLLIFSLPRFFDVFQLNWSVNKEKSANEVKFLSYNVRLFNLYDWRNNINTRDLMLENIKNQEADIICFQEFYYERHKNFMSIDTICDLLNLPFFHIYNAQTLSKRYYFGQATFSKYPIVNTGEIVFNFSNNSTIFTDIKIHQDTIRVYNNHLESIRFMQEEYNLIDSIGIKFQEKRYLGLVKKLGSAYKLRAREVDIISDHIKRSPYPVIVCGDFNDTPVSYTYHKMKGNLYDAFKVSGFGTGTTYNGKVPFQRIDYILYSDEFESRSFEVGNAPYSDHFPISCLFEITE